MNEFDLIINNILKEEYVYMYPDTKIAQMSWYQKLVLAHEIEYKWFKIKNIRPDMQRHMYNLLRKIYEQFVPWMYDKLVMFIKIHDITKHNRDLGMDFVIDKPEVKELVTRAKLVGKELLSPKSKESIETMLRAITHSLNAQHQSGNLITDYWRNKEDELSEEDLKSLSDLPTRRWDVELEKEFDMKFI